MRDFAERVLRGEVPVAYLVGTFDTRELERVCREQLAALARRLTTN